MNQSFESETALPQSVPQSAQKVLDEGGLDGELVILTVKPSGWYAFLVSFPVIAIATLAVGALILLVRYTDIAIPGKLAVVVPVCMVGACVRFFFGCSQWMGRVYVLTNRRVIRVSKSMLRTETFSCPLKLVKSLHLQASMCEKLLGVANLNFEIEGKNAGLGQWSCLANPSDIKRIVADSIKQVR